MSSDADPIIKQHNGSLEDDNVHQPCYEEQHPRDMMEESSRKRDREQFEQGVTGSTDDDGVDDGKPPPDDMVSPHKKVNNEQWDEMYQHLASYKEEHGDCLVPKRYTNNPKLGTWVETQRVQYKRLERVVDEETQVETIVPNKRLNAERLEKLELLGFAWSAKNVARKKSPSPVIPGKAKKPPSQEDVGRSSTRQRVNDAQWDEMYHRLALYKEFHGDCLVPRKYDEDPKLATWVETQRVLWNRDFRQSSGKIKLEDTLAPEMMTPGVAMEGKTPDEWVDEIGKSDTGGATAEDAAELAATMNETDAAVAEAAAGVAEEVADAVGDDDSMDQLKLPAKRLSRARKEKLDALGFVWSLRSKRIDDHWDDMFRQLELYKEKHGDCLVPSRHEENMKLGKWVETQRYEYTKLQRLAEEILADEKFDGEETSAMKARRTNQRLTEERLLRLESIGFEWKVKHKMKRYYDKQWDQMFERLLAYKAANGHCLVPKRYPPDMKLGTWVHTQRIQYRKLMSGALKKDGEVSFAEEDDGDESKGDEEISFRLTDDRRKRLEEVGFVWNVRENDKGGEVGRITRNSYDDQWDTMFQLLEEYKQRNGDCLVPKRYKENPKLGTWVDTQRVQYKKMKKKLAENGLAYDGPPPIPEGDEEARPPPVSPKPVIGRLTDDRIRRLEGLGFVWSLRDDWAKHYDELKEFKKENGHCNVPARYHKNRRLGIWVSAQRQQYKMLSTTKDDKARRSAPLTQQRIDKLNELGFTWTIRSRDALGESWQLRFEELKQYKAEHGNCLVPSRYPPLPELGVWVGTQRAHYRLWMRAKETGTPVSGNSVMNEERINQLEELGFVWALRGDPKRDADFDGDDVMDDGEVVQDDENLHITHDVIPEPTPGEVLVCQPCVVGDPMLRDAMEQAEI